MDDFRDRTAVITGAASGIGQALAVEAAARGMRVVAADVNPAEETIDLIVSGGGKASARVCDIADQHAVTDLAVWCERQFGPIHVLAANAGTGAIGSLEECSAEDFARVMAVNLFGTFYSIKEFAPLLRRAALAAGPAAVLITASEHSLGVPPDQRAAAYTISKHALLGMADLARNDLRNADVSVTLLCPGWTLTPAVVAYLKSDPEAERMIGPIAQLPEAVAARAWDAVAQGTFLTPTNAASRGHAMSRVQEIASAFDRL